MRVEIGLLLIAFLVLLLLYVRRVILSKKVSQLIKEFARAFEEMKFEYQPTHLPKKMDDTFYALKKVESVFQSELSNLIRQNKIMLSIMSSVSEGIISIDEKLRVKFANASAIKLLKLDFPVKDRNLLELIRNPDVEQMVIQILHGISDYPEFIEWRFDDKIFKITSSPIKVGKTTTGAVVVISDITSVKKIEKTRRDFVANVSHEFKAPLSAIKVAVDTISQEKDENAIQKFLSIIRKSADYLTNMVDKLLELARLESGALKPEFCSTNISEIIESAIEECRQKAKAKNINLEYKKANITADLDRHLFHIALVNLIDNAISYTQDGGSVNISAAADPANIAICVEDTGIGIPQEEHERIFERFYRIDKSRDKQTGGAGLGLSIVKHIVKLHNGSVFVESEQGKGSKFFIKIPLKRR